MVMQFERGRTMHDYIQEAQGRHQRALPAASSRMLSTACVGSMPIKLPYLDIKPSNIYLAHRRHACAAGFGAARRTLVSDQPILKPMYTPGFASPEQLNGREGLGPWERHLQRRREALPPALPGPRRCGPTSACAGPNDPGGEAVRRSLQQAIDADHRHVSASRLINGRKVSMLCRRPSQRALRRRSGTRIVVYRLVEPPAHIIGRQ